MAGREIATARGEMPSALEVLGNTLLLFFQVSQCFNKLFPILP
jgi:hypothetical protein